jgi:putative Mn2+ efflux pump MntP
LIEFSQIAVPLIIGILAGVDNFRAGLGLGALRIDPVRRKQMMLYFLIFESMMPTLGLLVGNAIGELTTADHLTNFIGCAILGSLGVYVILNSLLKAKEVEKEKEKKYFKATG